MISAFLHWLFFYFFDALADDPLENRDFYE